MKLTPWADNYYRGMDWPSIERCADLGELGLNLGDTQVSLRSCRGQHESNPWGRSTTPKLSNATPKQPQTVRAKRLFLTQVKIQIGDKRGHGAAQSQKKLSNFKLSLIQLYEGYCIWRSFYIHIYPLGMSNLSHKGTFPRCPLGGHTLMVLWTWHVTQCYPLHINTCKYSSNVKI